MNTKTWKNNNYYIDWTINTSQEIKLSFKTQLSNNFFSIETVYREIKLDIYSKNKLRKIIYTRQCKNKTLDVLLSNKWGIIMEL